jgi:pantetheine-phosphate adenylyltransferase
MNALIPGSYDPITLGHVNIIERAASMFDKIFVAVMNNDSAKYDKTLSSKEYLFTMEQRLQMIKLATAHIGNVVCVASEGRVIDLCDELEISAIIRGIRNENDLKYEMIHAKWNREHNDRAQTLFMPCDESLSSISSTAVRELIAKRDVAELAKLVSPAVAEYIASL